MDYQQYITVSDEVQAALKAGKAVVALESTIISHGMPYPDNVKTALELEEIVRAHGAVPATIAILGGRIRVGLSRDEVEMLGKAKDVVKVSRRDLPFVVAKGLNGATTVASTMIAANLAGIKVFATGGIGGVHRRAQQTFDISADLTELAQTDVLIVCAGAKSILDISLTLEVLETYGVPVAGYQTDEFPAFYTRISGHRVDYRCDSALDAARAAKTKWDLGLRGGIVVANPVPLASEIDSELITKAIDQALQECEANGVAGKDTTPFLLAKVKEITGGQSLVTNIALVKNNAKVAAEIAVALAKISE